ncbi:hypothetical protein RMCBS344292_02142 [Rhizopus microsporus]|nr:hypothetical protein RMCBS344292_02142 [Rhizopus microsporus]
MVIESNAENLDQDALKLLESNQESQRMLHSLSKYGFQLSMIRECLELVNHEEILGKVWNYGLENCATIRQQRFHRLVQHVLTWFFSRCSRIIPIKTNHERAYFVDFVVPIFQFFHDQIRHLDFQWCVVYIQSRNTGLMDMQTWAKERVCYADGIGYNGQDEMILIESSSGGLNEDLDHTLGDSPKLLENLTAILNTHRGKYLYSDKATFKKLKILGIQSVKTSITLVSVSITDNGTFLYQTHRTTGIPTEMKQSFCLVSLFELLAFLLDACQEQDQVIMQLQKEHTGIIPVLKENTVKELVLQELTRLPILCWK